MSKALWNPVAFTAGPLGAYESVYVEGDRLVRCPVIGVLIEEQMRLLADGALAPAGARRAVFAVQAAGGAKDVVVAGEGAANFVGVYPVGEDPPESAIEEARRRVEREDAWDAANAQHTGPGGLPIPG